MILYKIVRYFLFFLSPELAHNFVFDCLKIADKFCLLKDNSNNLPNKVFTYKNLTFKNPIGLAAGLDKNGDYISPLAKMGFGFLELGTVTPRPQSGNPLPRLFRLKNNKGIINRMGFNNKGVDYLVEQIRKIKNKNFIIGVNIGKNKDTPEDKAVEDYVYCLEKCFACADYITINISSPNTPGLRNLQAKDKLSFLIEKFKEVHGQLQEKNQKQVPLFLKIAADLCVEEVKDICEVCLQYKIDGLVLTNTTINKQVIVAADTNTDQIGGISGLPLFESSTKILSQVKSILENEINHKMILIGVGGIDSPDKAAIKMQNGAHLIQIYTGLIYEGPGLVKQLITHI